MAAKSIKDAIQLTMHKPMPEHEFPEALVYELRDYFAHRIMILDSKKLDGELTAVELFGEVFADYPAFKVASKNKA